MEQVVVYIALVLIGACLGSFAGATVWRLRARQLLFDKKHKEPYDKDEFKRLKPLLDKKTIEDRSQCLHCGYALKWYDLIPVISWLTLGGRCRSCRTFFGWFELLMELGTALFFVLSYAFWPLPLETSLQITHFVLWLIAGVIMAILFAYDMKWFLLPDRLNIGLAVVGALIVAVLALQSADPVATVLNAAGAVLILAGLYAALFIVSRGAWVGLGDVKLGVGLALLLADWQLAFLALFLANLLGSLIVAPLLATKKLKRTSKVPFGPLLIAGAILAWFVGPAILAWYGSLVLL